MFVILENQERSGNLHGHIVSVNEAHDEISRRGNLGEIPIEEEIVAVNEGIPLTIQTAATAISQKQAFLFYDAKSTQSWKETWFTY